MADTTRSQPARFQPEGPQPASSDADAQARVAENLDRGEALEQAADEGDIAADDAGATAALERSGGAQDPLD